jgi:hypothetical protein
MSPTFSLALFYVGTRAKRFEMAFAGFEENWIKSTYAF